MIAVGKIKERFYAEAVSEYQKRLSRYCRLDIVEVKDEPAGERLSPAERRIVLEREGERILKFIGDDGYVIALAIDGKTYDSIEFSEQIARLGLAGESRLYFIIGGSLGLSAAVLARADLSLSFSKMTFPHQLMRVILLEQLYRSCRIISHEPYHK